MKPREIEAQVERLVRPVVEATGLEFVDVQVAAEPAGTVLRILLDRQGGIDLDALSDATKAIDPVLEREAPLAGRYRLEVSSPGVERPLRTREHFERFAGEQAHVRTVQKIEGRRNFRGMIESVEGETIIMRVDETAVPIPLDNIAKAHLVVEA